MRVTRKIQSLAEAKIRHAVVTGPLPHIVRSLSTDTQQRSDENKSDAEGAGQSK